MFTTVSTWTIEIMVTWPWKRRIHADRSSLLLPTAHSVPFWELSHNLASLAISFGMLPSFTDEDVDADAEEQFEEDLDAIQVPLTSPPRTVSAKNRFHLNIASRTIIAAATSYHLRRLSPSLHVQHAFAIRDMMPFWVLIDVWEDGQGCCSGWAMAASTLRPLLSHASLWLGTSSSRVPREDRELTPEELQSLQSYFEQQGSPEQFHDVLNHEFVTGRYLAWIAEDDDVAKVLSIFWNVIVAEPGGADCLRCECEMCEAVA